MTREEAIDILGQRETCRECVADCTCKECDEAFEMAIKALEQEQQSEWERDHEVLKAYADGQESVKVCEDAVSREKVLKAVEFEHKWLLGTELHHSDIDVAFCGLKDRINKLPYKGESEDNE